MRFKRGDVVECTFSNHPWVKGERYVIKGPYSGARYRITHSLYGGSYSFPERYMKPYGSF